MEETFQQALLVVFHILPRLYYPYCSHRLKAHLQKKKIDEALVKMTVLMNKPFTDVENNSFRELLFAANRNYLVPSRRTLQRTLDSEAAIFISYSVTLLQKVSLNQSLKQ